MCVCVCVCVCDVIHDVRTTKQVMKLCMGFSPLDTAMT